MTTLQFNPILATDSYKLSHPFAYPKNVVGMFSYIEARTGGKDIIVPFALQMWQQKFLSVRITRKHVDEAEAFAQAHGEPFDRAPWMRIVTKYGGYWPVKIRAVPEGTPVRSGNIIASIQCDDPDVFWVASHLETPLLRGIWYPTTIASMDWAIKREIKSFYERTGADMSLLPFALHDFGGRGVTSAEQAEIGGAAHLVNFMGSDTIEGVRAANFYYDEPMSAFSVPATEHSVECSFGLGADEEIEYLRNTIRRLGKPGGIVSIVIDGRDVYRAAEALCTTLREDIIASGAKVVFRPDSGDMMEVVPRILRMQEMAFGAVLNGKGFKKINTVGIIQGDGVDHLAIRTLLGKLMAMGYSADNVVFGSGGALLQKVNRDTFKFAQKASAIKVVPDEFVNAGDVRSDRALAAAQWVGIAKDPITDPGKASKKGRLTLARSRMTGQLQTIALEGYDPEFEDVMQLVYDSGTFFNRTTLAEVRARAEGDA